MLFRKHCLDERFLGKSIGNALDALPPLETIVTWAVGIDYGTTNPFVALLRAVTEEAIYVCREWRWDSSAMRRQMTDSEYSDGVLTWLRTGADGAYQLGDGPSPVPVVNHEIFVDPSAASFRKQLQSDIGGWPMGADNDVRTGIRNTATLLSRRRLRIHRSCEGLLREMTGYVWDSKAQERGVDAPLKANDHGPDALRYAVLGLRRYWLRWASSFNDLEEAA